MFGECIKPGREIPGETTKKIYAGSGMSGMVTRPGLGSIEIVFAMQEVRLPRRKDVFLGKGRQIVRSARQMIRRR